LTTTLLRIKAVAARPDSVASSPRITTRKTLKTTAKAGSGKSPKTLKLFTKPPHTFSGAACDGPLGRIKGQNDTALSILNVVGFIEA
ncbi:hypothetical protein, partial [Pseudomonas protegens]|uniref:hypothetical protein n=1 Tax=Pseudomonas protegens TaxID=380021 RepID=UPI003906637A